MRLDLCVPYERRNEAKCNGAKWDAERKTWWVETDRVSPDQIHKLTKFVAHASLKKKARVDTRKVIHKAKSAAPVVTEQRTNYLPVCSCDVAPWEDCEHTASAIDDDAMAHMRSIAQE